MPCRSDAGVRSVIGMVEHTSVPPFALREPSRDRVPVLRPLSRACAGDVVVVRRLDGSAETNQRLREMGFGEQQRVRVISLQSHVLCQVCNARLGLSARLADVIWVEPAGGMSFPS